MTPRTIGRYEIRRELGRGMMGVVYEAHDPVLGRTVALKTISSASITTVADREAFERRFAAEAGIAARLSHSGIVVVHDAGRDEVTGLLFIAFERLPGDTLAALLERGVRLSWREGLEIVRRVAEALQHAHEQGVIHRDIKPANIMLLPGGQPKVMDFGIAKVESAHLSAAGQFFGTPLYMSPEQALSHRVDARSDVFSLGSVAYALLTGRQAFEAESVMKILGRVVHHDALAPTRLDAGLPADVDYLVARSLAKSPDDRYPSARHLAEDVGDVLDGRAPRHRASWVPPPPILFPRTEPVLVAKMGPGAFLPTITVSPLAEDGDGVPALPAALAPPPNASAEAGRETLPRDGPPHWWTVRSSALPAALVIALAVLEWSRLGPPEAPTAGARAPRSATRVPSTNEAIEASPGTPGAESSPPLAAPDLPSSPPDAPVRPSPARVRPPARVVVDLEHPLEAGRLRLWIDGEEQLVATIKGEVTKNLVLFKLRGGVQTEVLDVRPGPHLFRAEVSWGEEQRTEEIKGRFDPGGTYRLEVRLGRMSKELTLRWTR